MGSTLFKSVWKQKLLHNCIIGYNYFIVSSTRYSALGITFKLLQRLECDSGCKECSMSSGVNPSKGAGFGRLLFPWVGSAVDKHMIRNLSKILGDKVNSVAKAIAAQERFLDLLAGAVLDNGIVFDYLLVEQGGCCSVINTSCCTWINTSGKVETKLDKVQVLIWYLNSVPNDTPRLLHLF